MRRWLNAKPRKEDPNSHKTIFTIFSKKSNMQICRLCKMPVTNIGIHLTKCHTRCTFCKQWVQSLHIQTLCNVCHLQMCNMDQHLKQCHKYCKQCGCWFDGHHSCGIATLGPIFNKRAKVKPFVTVKCDEHRGTKRTRSEIRNCEHCFIRPMNLREK